jgi:hypothetical protein
VGGYFSIYFYQYPRPGDPHLPGTEKTRDIQGYPGYHVNAVLRLHGRDFRYMLCFSYPLHKICLLGFGELEKLFNPENVDFLFLQQIPVCHKGYDTVKRISDAKEKCDTSQTGDPYTFDVEDKGNTIIDRIGSNRFK